MSSSVPSSPLAPPSVDALFAAAHAGALAFRHTVSEGPQRPQVTYRDALALFDAPTPEEPADGVATIETLIERARPGLHAMVGGRFFGWVIGASHPVGVAADWLAAAWGQNAGNHEAAPAASAAETVAARWLLDVLDLPRESSVGFVTGATVANFVCLAAARSDALRRAGWDVEADGLQGAPPVRVLIGADAHTTVFLALQMLGFGHRQVERIPTDAQGRMSLEALQAAVAGDPRAPLIVVAQAGQINTGAFDPIDGIADTLSTHTNAWLHVDGAFGLWARACPGRSALARGVDRADSWATDGHKWLQTPYDSGYAIVRHLDAHRRAMTAAASYLPPEGAGERDPSRYVPELSRRARGFATWAMLRTLGRQGVATLVEGHCLLAERLAARLRQQAGITVVNDVVLNQVIVRFGSSGDAARDDQLTQAVISRLQQDGTVFAGGARWRDQWVLRLSICGWPTTADDIDAAAEAITRAWEAVCRD